MSAKKNRFLLWKISIICFMLLLGRWMYDKLPLQVPMHRNFAGAVDGYGSRLSSVLTLPFLCVFLVGLFSFLPAFDPKKEVYKESLFVREIIQIGILLFFAYIYAIIFYVVFHPALPINAYVLWGISLLFFFLWIAMRSLKRNSFVGIRTPRTLADETVWTKTHILWSRTFGIAGICSFFAVLFDFFMFPIAFSCILLGALIPIVYSFFLYKKTLQ